MDCRASATCGTVARWPQPELGRRGKEVFSLFLIMAAIVLVRELAAGQKLF